MIQQYSSTLTENRASRTMQAIETILNKHGAEPAPLQRCGLTRRDVQLLLVQSSPVKTRRKQRKKSEIIPLVKQAKSLIEQGETVWGACMTVGIQPKVYYTHIENV